MPEIRRYYLNSDRVLWADHKSLLAVLALKKETIEQVWEATYQGNPTPSAGSVFKRAWWTNRNRFYPDDSTISNRVIARYISWDTGLKDDVDAAFTVAVVGELLPDYRMLIRYVYRDRLEFPFLPGEIESLSRRFNRDGKLRAVIIEDRASGTSAYQTLINSSDRQIAASIIPFNPTVDKESRAKQAAVWCNLDCVLLPHPSESVPFLIDFEDELFDFPGTTYKDQVDAFSQLIIYSENILATGYRARNGTSPDLAN